MNLLKRLRTKPQHFKPLLHAFDPDELMLLFPELGERQDEILNADAGLRNIEDGEKVIGCVEREFTRRLVLYGQFYNRRRAEELVKAQFGSEHERVEADENARRFDEAGDALKELMFLAIKQEIGVWDQNLAIRKDWKIVSIKKPEMPEMFRRMFGGG